MDSQNNINPLSFSYDSLKNVFILGGTSEIGLGLARQIRKRNSQVPIHLTYRDERKIIEGSGFIFYHLEPLEESSWQNLIDSLKDTEFDLIISTLGILHDEKLQPEKSLRNINVEDLTKSFQINAITAPFAMKYLWKHLPKKRPSVVSFLSAKVGSISDNALGGWYGYRASKAALNMFVKTMSIELERKRIPVSISAIHPGTTETKLSQPFLAAFSKQVWSPDESADHILDTLEKSYAQGTGLFKNWDGSDLPW